jgi:3-methyl-2-oxobutanoate hydroxymethyltransferase
MPDKIATRTLQQMKAQGQRIVAVTAYDYPSAQLADAAGVDVILVGDSVANTVLGYETTLPVRMETMLHHLQAARRGVQRALLVADMPFLSYGVSVEDAVYNAGALMQAGAEAVKVEGASPRVLESIRAMVGVGIPVMAHLGLTPQSIHQFGGYRLQGRTCRNGKPCCRRRRRCKRRARLVWCWRSSLPALLSASRKACRFPPLALARASTATAKSRCGTTYWG